MKRILYILAFIFFGLFGVVNEGWSETSTLTFTSACGGTGTAGDGVIWTITSDAAESVYDETKGIHYGTSKVAVSYLRLTTSGISGTITQIKVNASGASGTSAKLNVNVGGYAFDVEQSLTATANEYTFSGSASGTIVVAITQTSTKKALYCKSIVVTYTTSDINVTCVSIIDTLKLIEGNSETITPTITPSNATNKNVTWGSLNTEIATVLNGEVNAISEGTTKVWVKTEDGNKTDTCIVIVSPIPPAPAIDIAVWDTNAVYLNIENFDAISASIEGHGGNNIADDLFFSKYYESAGNVKLWAIYNGTDHDISLANVKVLVSSNGAAWDDTDGQKYKSLSSYGNIKPGYIVPEEEIIVYHPAVKNNITDENIIECALDSGVVFDNWYSVSNNTTAFSGDDGLMLLNGTDTLDIIGVMEPSKINNHTIGTIDNPIGDGYGWCCENGKTIDGNSVSLSTNRCLLIRKSSVKSGQNAISKNRNDFVTLCEEWVGNPVATGDDVVTSCKGFTYVSTFDYDEHYSSTSDLQELELDGTSKIEIENLSSHSCDELKIVLYDGNDGSADITTHIPIMIYNDSMSSDITSNCDVVIMHGATLTIDNNLTSNDVTVYPGSILNISSGKTYTVNSLILRRDNDSVPYLSYNGTLDIQNGIFFEMRTDGSDWRWLTLPDTFMTSEIAFSDEISIGQYNGSRRAEQGRNGWEVPTEKNFKPGDGFIFGVDLSGSQKKIYKYELNKGILDITEHTVAVSPYGYGINPLPSQNDLGWNLIGNPFLDNFVTDDLRSHIKIGKLVKTNTNPWDGKWDVDVTGDLRYIVERCYDNDETIIANGHYKSIRLDDGHMIKPFTSFFVQIPEGIDALVFNKSNLTTSHSPKRITSNNDETFLRINIGELKTGCYISNKFTDEYEANADLGLFENTSLYQVINGYNLVYSAINDSILNNGINIHTNGGVISLDDKTNVSDFDEINIFYNDNYYDLLNGDTPNVQGNFILFARRNKNDIPTGINENIINEAVKKFIHNGNVYILRENEVYNILGTKIR